MWLGDVESSELVYHAWWKSVSEMFTVFHSVLQVTHLEQSNAAMAEDLLQKTAVIQHYAMESRVNGKRLYHRF